jgi:hypothetical protein
MKAIIFIMKKRIDPDFTLEQAGQISMTEANRLFAGESDPKE